MVINQEKNFKKNMRKDMQEEDWIIFEIPL
jgi:hypothetical protein